MPTPTSSRSEILAQLVAGSPPRSIEALGQALLMGRVTLNSSPVGIEAVRHVGVDISQRIFDAFRKLRDGMDEQGVALALLTANELRRVERLERPDIEIAWTGPDAKGPLVRPTAAVVEEMLRAVRDVGEILIVGYSVTVNPNSPMDRIIELLGEASKRRAALIMVLHQDESAENRKNLLRAWNVFVKKPRIYTWDPPPDHPYTKLHAKAIVVDRLDVLVTSANLTFHGMTSNLELGLRVKGPQAAAIVERFDELIASGVLRPWT